MNAHKLQPPYIDICPFTRRSTYPSCVCDSLYPRLPPAVLQPPLHCPLISSPLPPLSLPPMSRKYNKKGETALLDDDSLTTTPVSTRDGGRRSGGRSSGGSGSRQRQVEQQTVAPPPEVEEEEDEEPKGFFSSKTNIIGAVVSVLVILAIIAGVAWFLLSAPADTPSGPSVSPYAQLLLDSVNRTRLANNFAAVTGYSTLAGTVPSMQAVTFVQDSFTASFAANSSIATVAVHTYYGLFNYPAGYDPNSANPSAADAYASRRLTQVINGTTVFTANLTENIIDMDDATKRTDAVPTCKPHLTLQHTAVVLHAVTVWTAVMHSPTDDAHIRCWHRALTTCAARVDSQRLQSEHKWHTDRSRVLGQLRHAGGLSVFGPEWLQPDW